MFLVLEAAICLMLCLFREHLPELFTTLIAFPLEQIGLALRQLSLSGSGGNVTAIILYLLICLSPLLFLIRRKHTWEDLLCILTSVYLFFSLYCMINPGLLCQWLNNPLGEEFERAFLGSMFYTFLLSYLLLRLLRHFRCADRQGLVHYLRILLCGLNILLIYLTFGSGFSGLLDSIHLLQESNQGNEHLLGVSYAFLALLYVIEHLPYILNVQIVFSVQKLLSAERNSEKAIAAADHLSVLCIRALVITLLAHVGYQILQLFFMRKIMQSWVGVQLPLFSLLFVLAVLLMAQYIRENKELKEDNDLFI